MDSGNELMGTKELRYSRRNHSSPTNVKEVVIGNSENVLSKAKSAQRVRREREKEANVIKDKPSTPLNTSEQAVAQRTRRGREKSGPLPEIPVISLSNTINISKRAAAQRARRDKEKKARINSQIPSSISCNEPSILLAATENPRQIQPSDDQVIVNYEVAKVIGESSDNRPSTELNQKQGDKEIVAPIDKAPVVSPIPATSLGKKINTSKRAIAQRARRDKEKQARVHLQTPFPVSSNEQFVHVPATKCLVQPCPIQHSDDQVAADLEVVKVIGENLNPPITEPNQKQGDEENIASIVNTSRVSPIPETSLSKMINTSRRAVAQRARREQEKLARTHMQIHSSILTNVATECSKHPCPVQPSGAQVITNVEVAKVVGENLANRADPKQTEGDTGIGSPLVKAPRVSPLPATSFSKTVYTSRRAAAQRARRHKEKQDRLHLQIPSLISSNEKSTVFPATECSENPFPNQPSGDQVTANVDVAKEVNERLVDKPFTKHNQTEGDKEIISLIVKAPGVTPIPDTSFREIINSSKRAATHHTRKGKEKQARIHLQIPSSVSSNEQSTFLPATEHLQQPSPIQPSYTRVTDNLEVAKVVGENIANQPFTEPKQTEGGTKIISPIIRAPSVFPVPDTSCSKKIKSSKRAAAQRARRDKEKQDRLHLQMPSLLSSNEQSTIFPATGCCKNPRPVRPFDDQVIVELEVAKAVGENLVNPPFSDPIRKEGDKKIISSVVKAQTVTLISDTSFTEVINTLKRAAAHDSRKDKEKHARVHLQIPSSVASNERSVNFPATERSEHPCPTQPSDDQVTINLEVTKQVGENLTNQPFTEPMQKEGDKEIISPMVDAPRVSALPTTYISKKINTSKRVAAQRARREKEKQERLRSQRPMVSSNEQSLSSMSDINTSNRVTAQRARRDKERKSRVASQLLLWTMSNKRVVPLQHPHLVQLSHARVYANLELAKVTGESSANRPFIEPKQKEGDKEVVSPVVRTSRVSPMFNTRTPRPWLQQRHILLPTGVSNHQVSSSVRASGNQLSFMPPKQNSSSVRASRNQLSSLPPKQNSSSVRASGHQVSSLPPKENFACVPASGHGLSSLPPKVNFVSGPVSDHGLSSLPPKVNFASVPASGHGVSSLPPKENFASVPAPSHVNTLPPKENFASAPALGHDVNSLPPKQKSASLQMRTKWSIVPSSPVRLEIQTNGLATTRQKLPVRRKASSGS